jgi:hypothetical protein
MRGYNERSKWVHLASQRQNRVSHDNALYLCKHLSEYVQYAHLLPSRQEAERLLRVTNFPSARMFPGNDLFDIDFCEAFFYNTTPFSLLQEHLKILGLPAPLQRNHIQSLTPLTSR